MVAVEETPLRLISEQTKPVWVTLSKDGFTDTVGYTLFPPVLEGRSRPDTIFQLPLNQLFHGKPSRLAIIQNYPSDLKTIADVLNLSYEQFQSLPEHNDLQTAITKHLIALAVTPHARLVGDLYNRTDRLPSSQLPIDPALEPELIGAVNAAVATLKSDEQRLLIVNYGLEDGIQPILKGNTTIRLSTARKYLLQSEQPTVRKLKNYWTVPKTSLAHKFFGATLFRELPALDGLIADLKLSDEIRRKIMIAINMYGRTSVTLTDLVTIPYLDLNDEEYTQITAQLQKVACDSKQRHLEMLNTEQTRALPQNLIQGIRIDRKEMIRLSQISINDLRFTPSLLQKLLREGITNVAELLAYHPVELGKLRNWGEVSLIEIGKIIENVLNLPDDICPKGALVRYFTKIAEYYKNYKSAHKEHTFPLTLQVIISDQVHTPSGIETAQGDLR